MALLFNGQPALRCEASRHHNPPPLRFIWHHVQPLEAGGENTADNMVQLCDSCHASVHRILLVMAQIALGKPVTEGDRSAITNPPRRSQLQIASAGYQACLEAGTIAEIVDEG